jgi:hypothetical protein
MDGAPSSAHVVVGSLVFSVPAEMPCLPAQAGDCRVDKGEMKSGKDYAEREK